MRRKKLQLVLGESERRGRFISQQLCFCLNYVAAAENRSSAASR
jgi:hypothetical protein